MWRVGGRRRATRSQRTWTPNRPVWPAACRWLPYRRSVRLVIVAALEKVEVPVVLLDPVVQLQVVLDDLGRGVALRPGVVREGQDREFRVRSGHRLHAGRVLGADGWILRGERGEPGG